MTRERAQEILRAGRRDAKYNQHMSNDEIDWLFKFDACQNEILRKTARGHKWNL